MDQWIFVIAAYLVTFAGLASVVFGSFTAMRRAEKRAADLRGRD